MDLKEYEEYAKILKALAHPQRLCIVSGLMEKESNVTAMKKCLGCSQSSVSQHLASLKAAGIVEGKRYRNEICYGVINPTAKRIVNSLFLKK